MVLSADVTRRKITLGTRDSTTGWRAITYTESTVEALRFPRGAHYSYQGVGVFAREDAMFLTADPVEIYDQLYTGDGKYYVVKTVQEHWILDSFAFRELQCAELPLWQSPPASATWKTSPNDPRERTKTWIDTYARDAQITKDDGSTQASWATIFAGPPYPLELEFRGASNIHGLYVVGEPNSTSMMDAVARAPYGYEEHVPIHIYTVDSTDVTGTALHWKMKAELRYVAENYPTGSLRSVGKERSEPIHLGSMILYHSEHVLNYRRGTT